MIFMNLIILFDFIQVLNILRKHSTKNEYFCMHILFTTIYLLYKQKLNHEKLFCTGIKYGKKISSQ
jgi:hypothetical protein